MAFERGFKAWADRTAVSLRRDLGLDPHAVLPPRLLADHLSVRLLTPSDIPGLSSQSLHQLLRADSSGWSAVTCRTPGGLVVIYNSSHALARQSNDIMHELSHVLLNHASGRLVLSQDGKFVMRNYDRDEEDAADWLAGALLLPREALVRIVRLGTPHEAVCEEYTVSRALLNMRLQLTGVLIQARRRARRTGR